MRKPHLRLPNLSQTNTPLLSAFTPLSASRKYFGPSRPAGRTASRIATLGLLVANIFFLSACAVTGSKEAAIGRFPDDQPDQAQATPLAPTESATWSILIVAYQGPEQATNAAVALENVQSSGGLPAAYLDQRGNNTVVAYGRYRAHDDPKAIADLKRIRSIVIDGGRPFADAVLVPPPSLYAVGAHPEYDLRTAKQELGPAAMYSLQIGVYKRMDGRAPSASDIADFRKAAEQAVVDLRREGVPAYYIHLPESSTVTIGVFGPDDYKLPVGPKEQPYRSPELIRWRERFPNNLVNGGLFYSTAPGVSSRKPQESSLVMIPAG